MLKYLSIKNTIRAFIALIIILSIALYGVINQTVKPIDRGFSEYTDNVVQRSEYLLKIRSVFGYGGGIHLFKNYVLRGTPKYADRFRTAFSKTTEVIKAYGDLPNLHSEEAEALRVISSVFMQYNAAVDTVEKMLAQGNPTSEIDKAIKISDSPALKAFQILEKHFTEKSKQYRGEMDAGIQAVLSAAMYISLAVAIILAFAFIFFGNSVTTRLAETISAMNDVAHGEGDLTKRLDGEGKDEIAELARGFNSFADKIANVIGQVSTTSDGLSGSSSSLSTIAQQTQIAVTNQKMELDQVATAMTEMSATVQDMAVNTTAAAESADQAKQETENVTVVVSQTIESINLLAAEVESATIVIDTLEKDSDKIGSVLDVIKGIAEQTNLLALNAAIEAARAGEQGRGFAVVADEVRTLAGRTQESTQEIQQTIEKLQAGTSEAVAVMNRSRSKTEDSVEKVSEAGKSLESITQAVNTITNMSLQIATAVEEQTAVAGEISHSIVTISNGADDTIQGADQVASASREQVGQVEQLHSLVSQFNV